MSYRGAPRARGGSNGAPLGRGGYRGRGDTRGGGYSSYGPPATVLEMGSFMHPCEGQLVCKSINVKIPYFNAPCYLENKTQIGKVDEIFGPLEQVMYTIQPQEGIVATSFRAGDKFYIGGDRLLPLDRFLPKPKPPPGQKKPKRAGGASRGGPMRGGRGGRGGPLSRGFNRGGARGGRGGFGSDRGGRGGGSFSRGRGTPSRGGGMPRGQWRG